MDVETLNGPDLKALRRKAGISQTRMAEMIGTSRHAVSYWETKRKPFRRYDLRWGKPAEMLKALGVELPYFQTTARPRGAGVLDWRVWQQAALDREIARLTAASATRAARLRQPCGARTRKGTACRL